jgi:hypothetical protein
MPQSLSGTGSRLLPGVPVKIAHHLLDLRYYGGDSVHRGSIDM